MQEKYRSEEYMDMYDGKVVLCGANSYEEKYYLNPDFAQLPDTVIDAAGRPGAKEFLLHIDEVHVPSPLPNCAPFTVLSYLIHSEKSSPLW